MTYQSRDDELVHSAKRHADRLIKKMMEVIEVPSVVQDSIRREMEYTSKDGMRITMRWNAQMEKPRTCHEIWGTPPDSPMRDVDWNR